MPAAQAKDSATALSQTVDAVRVVAPGNCWNDLGQYRDASLTGNLAQCAKLGVDSIRLTVSRSTSGELQACASRQWCDVLTTVLAARPAPELLLETPVALLDEVQRAVTDTQSAGRVKVAPLFVAPKEAELRVIAPGLRYRVERHTAARPMMVHILEIDLAQNNFEFVATPALPADASDNPMDKKFRVEKTTDFAARQGLIAAINASYFLPFDGGRLLLRPFVPAVGGLATATGAQPMTEGQSLAWQRDIEPRIDAAVCVSAHRPQLTLSRTRCAAGSELAFVAGPMLIEHGVALALKAKSADEKPDSTGEPEYYRTAQPRTAIGVDATARKAWFVVVDGRQSGYSEGMRLSEMTELFQRLGARDAMNLDGGGSTTMVLEGALVNSPIHTAIPGRERPVADHFGLRLRAR